MNSSGEVTDQTITDDDPAFLVCSTTPKIDIEKQVRLPGGSFVNADTLATAVKQTVPNGVEYRFRIKNAGNIPLTDVRVTDSTLGIANVKAANSLLVGKEVIITSRKAGFGNLNQPNRCKTPGNLINIAMASAIPKKADGTLLSAVKAEDPAHVICEGGTPQIELEKQISIDGVKRFRC